MIWSSSIDITNQLKGNVGGTLPKASMFAIITILLPKRTIRTGNHGFVRMEGLIITKSIVTLTIISIKENRSTMLMDALTLGSVIQRIIITIEKQVIIQHQNVRISKFAA